ncbi:MAG: hypothetical protein HYU66_18035 [Armatimonadetes bacterium]|nr:hypothetical protein [Armatimonadota bacterium]
MPLADLPGALLEVADDLVQLDARRRARASLRRAVSTAYYALFHLLVRAAVQRMFRNQADRDSFGPAAARGFAHDAVGNLADDARRHPQQRRQTTNDILGTRVPSADLRAVCEAFVATHAAREAADYDLAAAHRKSDVQGVLLQVRGAFEAWTRVSKTDEGRRFAVAMVLLARQRRHAQ